MLVGRALGPYKVPGHPTEMLFGSLYGGGQLRDWVSTGGWGRATVAVGEPPWWPGNLALSALQAIGAEPGWIYGLALFAALWLAGGGPYALALRLGARPLVALVAGILVQLAPPVLRAAGSGEVAVLAVGPAALAMAMAMGSGHRSRALAGLLALLAGAWGTAGALTLGLLGLQRRRRVLLLALLPLIPALLVQPSAIPGAARMQRPVPRTVEAYVAAGGAVIPLPPAEAEGVALPDPEGAPAPAEAPPAPPPPESGLLFRLPGGLGLWAALLAGLVAGRRRAAAVGLGLGILYIALFGLLPPAGQPPPIPPAWLLQLGPFIPGLRAPVGLMEWMLPLLLCLPMALPGVPGSPALLVPGLVSALTENPRLTVPVTNLAPDAIHATAAGLPPGPVVVFPSAAHPYRQGHRSTAEWLLQARLLGHAIPAGPQAGAEAPLIATLSRMVDEPVDLAAGPAIWAGRELDPLQAVQEAGFVALVIDRAALEPQAAFLLDGWLASKVGMPLAVEDDRALYLLQDLDDAP